MARAAAAHGGVQGRRSGPTTEPPRRGPHHALRRRQLSARTLVLDGEIAIYDQQLRSRFEWLREPAPDAVATLPLYMTFDVLYHDGRDLSARRLRERHAQLNDIIAGSGLVFPVRRLAPDGQQAWAQVVERGDEGLVAKDEAAPTRRTDEAVAQGVRVDRCRGPVAAGEEGTDSRPV